MLKEVIHKVHTNGEDLQRAYLGAVNDPRFHLKWPDKGIDIPVRSSILPKLTCKPAYEALKPELASLTGAVEKVSQAFRNDPGWAISLGFPTGDMAAINSLPFTTAYWMARFDLFVHNDQLITGADGKIRVWSPEWNSNIPGGSAWAQLIKDRLSSQFPGIKFPDYLNPIATSIKEYQRDLPGGETNTLAMVVDPHDRSEMDVLADLLVRDGHFEKVVVVSDPNAFSLSDSQLMVADESGRTVRVNVVYRKEKAQRMMRGDRGRSYAESQLWQALKDGVAVMLNPLDSYFLASRLTYPIIYEAARNPGKEFDQRLGGLSTDEAKAVLNIVPESYVLRDETFNLLQTNPNSFVVKTDGSCGANVYLPNSCNVVEEAMKAIQIPGGQAIAQKVMTQSPFKTYITDKDNNITRGLVVGGFDPYVFKTKTHTEISDAVISRFHPITGLDELPVKANVGNPDRPAKLAIVGYL